MGSRLFVALVVLTLSLASVAGPWGGVEPGEPAQSMNVTEPPTAIGPGPEIDLALSTAGYSFLENRGQLDNDRIVYYARGNPLSVGLTTSGVVFLLADGEDTCAFSLRFEGGSPADPVGVGTLGHSANYFRGSDPDGWVREARSFEEVTYDDVYEGIDARFYFQNGMFKYDMILEPGVDPGVVRLAYDGVESLSIDEATGDLLITTKAGILRDVRPVMFQEDANLEGSYELIGETLISFSVSGVDPGLPLTIDPGLEFSTFLGGGVDDYVREIGLDASGNVYVIGNTNSTDFPTTPGSFCQTLKDDDIFVSKFDPSGSLLYSTFIGNSFYNYIHGYEVAADGRVFLIGTVYNFDDFPLTDDAHRKTMGGDAEAFFLELKSDGSDLLHSTYVGGDDYDSLYSISRDEEGNIYLCGSTTSMDLPVTEGAFCETKSGGSAWYADLFLMKLNGTTYQVELCTYISGTRDEYNDRIFLDDDGGVIIAGKTESDDFPTTTGAFCRTLSGNRDLVLLKMDPDFSNLVFSTYLGGQGGEFLYSVRLLEDGSFLLAGDTNEDFPVPEGAFCETCPGGARPFVAVMNPTGTSVSAATFLGMTDGVTRIVEAFETSDGDICIVGHTNATDFPTTPDAIITSNQMGDWDLFITILDRGLTKLQYSTLLGGDDFEWLMDCLPSTNGETVNLVAKSESPVVPSTPGCFDRVNRGGKDVYFVRFNLSSRDLDYATSFGGRGTEEIFAIAQLNETVFYLGGYTYSGNFPTTTGALDRSLSVPPDGFVVRLSTLPIGRPDAPTGLEAVAGNGVVDLSWDQPSNTNGMVTSHRIYRANGTGLLVLLDEEILDKVENTLYDDKDVLNGIKYTYRISAVSGGGESPLSATSSSAIPRGPPSTPLNLTASTGNGTITLSWEPPLSDGGLPLQGYNIFKGASPDTLQFERAIGTITIWTDTNVNLDAFYYYALKAFSAHGPSQLSEAVRIKPKDVPSIPPSFTVTPEDGRVTLVWNFPFSTGGSMLVGFHVWRMEGGGAMAIYVTLSPDKLTFIDDNVTNGRQYTYMVSAYSEVGEGRTTDAVDVTPFGLPGEVMLVEATAGVGEVTLVWSPPEDDGGARLKGYVIFWGTASGNLDQEQKLGNFTSFTHSGLENGVTYYYQIVAENAAGLGSVSIVVHATPMGLPGPVRELTVEAVPAGVQITWTIPSETGGVESLKYWVLRGTTDDPTDLLVELVDAFEHLDTSVVRGTTYHYRVVAVSTMGEGDPGAVVQVTAAGVPAQTADLVATAGNAMVELAWSAPDDGSSPIIEYVVLRGEFEDALEVVGRTTTPGYSDGTAENGKTYYYRVFAVNAIGNGERSEVSTAMPKGPPGSPGVLEAKAKGGNIVLTWVTPTGGNTAVVTGYKVYRGESEYEMELLTELGLVNTYTDGDIKRDRYYYYKVVATSDSGDSEMSRMSKTRVVSEEGPGFGTALAVLAMASVVTVAISMRRRR